MKTHPFVASLQTTKKVQSIIGKLDVATLVRHRVLKELALPINLNGLIDIFADIQNETLENNV